MFKTALQAYHARNKRYPEHILVYRDGVSSSEIGKVKDNEMIPIYSLILGICSNEIADMPECPGFINFNYVVVLKSIQTRFVRAKNDYPNPQAGTVIDTGVTLPGVLDFYLVAHHAYPGSSAPTRYQVYQNESSWNADFYQSVTNKLCSMYYNWFGAIKTPAHCQYAKALAKIVGQSEIRNDNERLRHKLYFL
jgi:aubergine-like protein